MKVMSAFSNPGACAMLALSLTPRFTFMEAKKPINEAQRQAVLDAYQILDTAPEQSFDDLVLIASSICDMPMGSITLIDRDRQWLKSTLGLGDAKQTSRTDAFCAHTILDPERVMVVNDAQKDPRFQDNPFVREDPNLRFYAGAPLVTPDGLAMGSICVMDSHPGHLNEDQIKALQALSRQVVQLLELRRVSSDLEDKVREQAWYEENLRQENADLISQTRSDPLTGLSNRRGFQDAQEAAQTQQQSAWVALIDIDHFKSINDTHGHPKGDEVLVALGQLLKAHARSGHTIARFGGEEFVWLMPGISGKDAAHCAEALRQAVAAMTTPLSCTISIGLAHWTDLDAPEDALQRADQALYCAKRGGRNQVCVDAGSNPDH
jgi:diguanylate cyclase (GGDEF)-like protein